jgi:Fic family protein
MLAILQEINVLHSKLKNLPALELSVQKKLEKQTRLAFSYNSNHLEGNKLTFSQTELLLIFDQTSGDHDMRELEEMKAHDVAYTMVKDWASNPNHYLTEINIRNLNEIILVRPFWKEAITADGQNTRRLINIGEYKKMPNSVRLQNGEIFEYASPIETPIKMGELMEWYHITCKEQKLHPVEIASILHHKFVLIHPFDDGNGRISRLLINYILLKNNYPPIIIKSEDKKNYLLALRQTDVGNIEFFTKYIAQLLLESLASIVDAHEAH